MWRAREASAAPRTRCGRWSPTGSQVRLHVAVPDARLGAPPDAAVGQIRRGIEEALDRLAGLAAPDPR